MLFSKSFDYALRGVLYVSLTSRTKKRILIEEISMELSVPEHFLRKVMNKLAKKGILNSTKGPFGGLSLNEETKGFTLLSLLKAVDNVHPYNSCVLKSRKCNAAHPCVMHDHVSKLRDDIYKILAKTTIDDILNDNKTDLLQKITLY